MIISQLIGGLGNQMFQYAFGYVISKRLRVEHKLYFASDIGTTPRNFELSLFNISAKQVLKQEAKFVSGNSSIIRNLICKFKPSKFHIVSELGSEHRSYRQKIKDNSILKGYWQSEKYFIDYEPEIRREFSFNEKLEGKNKYLAEIINKSDAVSIHIRRGDYLSDKNTNAFHGICDLEYYKNAMKTIEKKIKRPTYFFFSDDPAWVKKNLLSKYETHYIDWNSGEESYRDMQLMSLCDHNIIANSSFSWWGAWLNNNPSKIVIAPKIWYRDGSINTKDLVPDKWVRI